MAHVTQKGKRWRVEVCIDRVRKSKTFDTKKAAVEWGRDQEGKGLLVAHTLKEALIKYEAVAKEKKGHQAELSRLKSLAKMDCAGLPLESITPAMIQKYRDKRLKKLQPVSVRRELIVLGSVFREAVEEWHWLHVSPMEGVKKPPTTKGRRRGMSQAEIDGITAKLAEMRVGKQVADLLALSLETGMRLGEMLSLTWADVSEKFVTLQDSKNGDKRDVPLSLHAREIIRRRRIDPETVFTLSPHVASKTFQRARDAAGYTGVHFHDARGEAITRLSKKLDVLQLAKMIGHRDIKSLMIYYAESAESIADRL